MTTRCAAWCLGLAAVLPGSWGCSDRSHPTGVGAPDGLLPPSQQVPVREGWIARRHELLLEQMRRHDIAMLLLVTEEFHPDPLAEVLVSPRPLVSGRDVYAFVDTGAGGLRKVAAAGRLESSLEGVFEAPEGKPAEVLAGLVREYDPKAIGLSVGGRRGPTSSLTHDSYRFLAEAVGPAAEARFVSAAELIEEILDTRLPEERPHVEALARVTDELAARALSPEVVTPGTTTVGAIRSFLVDQAGARGLGWWFEPDVRVQRRGGKPPEPGTFLEVAPDATVIQEGDLLHVDLGLVYMGLSSDWQRMAYVRRTGERTAPAGLVAALANANALQGAMRRAGRAGRPPGDVYREVMAEMERRGIDAMVYSHALGVHGHGVGPRVDFRAAKRDDTRVESALRDGSLMAVELNASTPVPEWDGQKVVIMQEDPAWITPSGLVFLRPAQETL